MILSPLGEKPVDPGVTARPPAAARLRRALRKIAHGDRRCDLGGIAELVAQRGLRRVGLRGRHPVAAAGLPVPLDLGARPLPVEAPEGLPVLVQNVQRPAVHLGRRRASLDGDSHGLDGAAVVRGELAGIECHASGGRRDIKDEIAALCGGRRARRAVVHGELRGVRALGRHGACLAAPVPCQGGRQVLRVAAPLLLGTAPSDHLHLPALDRVLVSKDKREIYR